ncbi:hypothetical protein ACHQM5_025322 [Ranunculus cassubicifolius]
MEGAGKGSMRSLGLVVIGVVMLLVCGVAEAGNPCYVESVQNCLNNCGLDFKGCATCPVICGMRDTCKHEINSAKSEEALAIQSDTIKKNTVGNVAGNPCYAECVQDCLNTCSFMGCASCPAICGTHDTCKHKINSGELEAAAMKQYCKVGCVSLVCAPMANILGLNSVADKQGSMERCNNGCSGFCTKHFGAAIATE